MRVAFGERFVLETEARQRTLAVPREQDVGACQQSLARLGVCEV
jgi:hypothetical protein